MDKYTLEISVDILFLQEEVLICHKALFLLIRDLKQEVPV